MIAHIIQWRVIGKTVSPIEPSETNVHAPRTGSLTRASSFLAWQFWRRSFWAFCLWLGLSHTCVAGSLRLAAQENGSSSEAVSVAAPGVRPARRRAVHVCLAHGLSIVFEPGARTNHPEIHESSGDHKFLGDVSRPSQWPSRFCLFAASSPFIFWGKKAFALAARMGVSSVLPTNSRREKSGLRLRAISAGIALPRALRTCRCMRK